MKQLKMHCSNFKYVYEYVIDPLSPTCKNCEFMPDKVCGWGYDYLEECVFQYKGAPYILYPTYDVVSDPCGNIVTYDNWKEKHWSEMHHRISVLTDCEWALEDYLKNSEIVGLNPFWSSDEELRTFYDDSWEHNHAVSERKERHEKDVEFWGQSGDYWRWIFQKEPCSLCGKVTREFIILGNRSLCKTSPVIKVCTGCIDGLERYCDDWISFGERLLQC